MRKIEIYNRAEGNSSYCKVSLRNENSIVLTVTVPVDRASVVVTVLLAVYVFVVVVTALTKAPQTTEVGY